MKQQLTDTEIEELAKVCLNDVHRYTTITVNDEEDNIFYNGFHMGYKKGVEELEAERSELLEKMTELLKAFNDSDKNYADWVATKELYMAFTGVNNLLERLNSLKTK